MILALIPARLNSSRLPNKPLLKINGTIKIATDIDDYAAQILRIMEKKKNFDFINSNFFQSETNNKIKFNLLYDKNRDLQKKIKIEQIRKETS